MQRILVIQLARLGDIVQTIPTVRALRAAHPNAHISLLVRETFQEAALLCEAANRVISFPAKSILGPVLADPSRNTESLHALRQWLAENLLRDTYSTVVNLTFSNASSFLTAMIPCRDKRGLSRSSSEKTLEIADPWSQYFYSHVLGGSLNLIHLNDLFARIARTRIEQWPQGLHGVRATSETANGGRLGIQITASQREKTPSVDVWVEILTRLLQSSRGYSLRIFGALSDAPIAEAVLAGVAKALPAVSGRIENLVGKTSFVQLPKLVSECERIISPDTAIVHIASMIGTPVLEICLGSVRAEETGPYGEGNDILYPVSDSSADLAIAVEQVVTNKPVHRRTAHAKTRTLRASDGSLRTELAPENFSPYETTNLFAKAYYLLAEFRCGGTVEDIDIPPLGDPRHKGSLDELMQAHDALCTARRLSEFGQHYCLQLLEAKRMPSRELQELGAKIAEIDRLLGTLQNSVPLIKPLLDLWRVSKDTSPLENGSIEEIFSIAEGAYRELCQNIEIVIQLIQTAVDTAQKRLENKATELAKSRETIEPQGKKEEPSV